jgi:hypothetical protein
MGETGDWFWLRGVYAPNQQRRKRNQQSTDKEVKSDNPTIQTSQYGDASDDRLKDNSQSQSDRREYQTSALGSCSNGGDKGQDRNNQ